MSAFPIEPDVAALREELIATRRDLHQHPEIGFEEFWDVSWSNSLSRPTS